MAGIRSAPVEFEVNKSLHEVLHEIRNICREHGIQECEPITDFLRKKLATTVRQPGTYTLSSEQLLELRKHPEASLAIAKLDKPTDLEKVFAAIKPADIAKAFKEGAAGIPIPKHISDHVSDVLTREPVLDFPVFDGEKMVMEERPAYAALRQLSAICQCGGDAAGTTHSDWCPKSSN